MTRPKFSSRNGMVAALSETFGLHFVVATLLVVGSALLVLAAFAWVVHSIPPRTVTLSSGHPGSTFARFARSYQRRLAEHGVELRILPSEGSPENLQRLQDPASGVDLAFVQGGLKESVTALDVMSLGSVSHEPLWIFYRGPDRVARLGDFAGKRVGIGALGSGTHTLALTLLKANGLTGANTTLLPLDAEEAAAALLAGRADAVFLMGDMASTRTLRGLLRAPGIRLFDFPQADAYVRRFQYLNKIELPEGAMDLVRNLPDHPVTLVGPTVELVARAGLNPALSDLLLEVAQQVHGRPGLFQAKGEFPAMVEHDFPLSDDAVRYHQSGKGLLYRALGSFWLASILNQILVVFVPTAFVLFSAVRFFPNAYRWGMQLRIYRFYRLLLRIEREIPAGPSQGGVPPELLARLDELEGQVNRLQVPAALADQFYGLRYYISFVRDRLKPPGAA
jgi:TRAP-type uncharacterized transport system substrate-binding protein